MLTQTIRRQFLAFFQKAGHTLLPSSPVLPHDDPSLLFINAGMNQFKDLFLGKRGAPYKRAATSQKCIRVGGKHNDLENVGHTSRHLTFFEMLGNFSFGDYFKKEAIAFSWQVATEVFEFDPAHIWPSVFLEDDEAFALWTQFVPPERITRFGEKDNFWAMGDTGPCGPCSELYYDKGAKFGSGQNPSEDPTGERYLEFWNLVFMQYNRLPSGEKEPLPHPSIDTGAGLERVISLKMGVENLFETDVLRSLIAQVEDLSHISYDPHSSTAAAFHVIADHLRSLAFAMGDGVLPSNVDRGYVLRKLIRRAVRYGRHLKLEKPFLAEVLPQLVLVMGEDFPELKQQQQQIAETLSLEEEAFFRTLKRGGQLLQQIVQKAEKDHRLLSGEDAFKLKDTYGLPLEEIQLLAKDHHLTVEENRFFALEEQAKERSRSQHKQTVQLAEQISFASFVQEKGETLFTGYRSTEGEGKITGLLSGQQFVSTLQEGEEGCVILDGTSFYPEMGGQVADTGSLIHERGLFTVTSTSTPQKGVIVHHGRVEKGGLSLGLPIRALVNSEKRRKIASNHTATHLLHFALQQVLKGPIKQAGSLVEEERFRFDFTYPKTLTPLEICQIEDIVNTKIRENRPVTYYELSLGEAQKQNDIKQFFGDKYGSTVRVVDIDSYSKELCGGTHAEATGQIGLFRLVKEGSIAAGVRRIEAVTGQAAEQFARGHQALVEESALLLKTTSSSLVEKLQKLLQEQESVKEALASLQKKQLQSLLASVPIVPGKGNRPPHLIQQLPVAPEELKLCAELLKATLPSGIVILGAANQERCQLLIQVSADWVQQGWSAQQLLQKASSFIGGSGGGKPGFAQGGGKQPSGLSEALAFLQRELA